MKTTFALATLALGLTALAFVPVAASAQDKPATPKDWGYEIVDGKRVPKAKRQANADGSWREERKMGDCVEVKERTAAGEIHITRTCSGDKKPD